MRLITYQIIRLSIFGLGLGILNGFVLGRIAGISWFLGYTLAWAFQPNFAFQEKGGVKG